MPYTPITVRAVVLLCFPPTDAVFAGLVRDLVDAATDPDPAALEGQLRRVYPGAVVRPRHQLAALRGPAWYVYRDGRYSPFAESPWWGDPSVARTVVGDDGCYLDANEAALALLAVDLETLRAMRSGDFTLPEYREIVPWIRQLLIDTGELHSVAVMRPRGGGRDVPVEFHFVRDGDGPGRHVAWMRRVTPDAVVPPSSEGAAPETEPGPGQGIAG